MKKELKDYLHLYIGCEAIYGGYGDPERKVKILGFSLKDGVQFQFEDNGEVDTDMAAEWFKPILRPLSDMTEEELHSCVELDNLVYYGEEPKDYVVGWSAFSPTVTKYLLSKHFDLFGLIEAGLAIDSTTLK